MADDSGAVLCRPDIQWTVVDLDTAGIRMAQGHDVEQHTTGAVVSGEHNEFPGRCAGKLMPFRTGRVAYAKEMLQTSKLVAVIAGVELEAVRFDGIGQARTWGDQCF